MMEMGTGKRLRPKGSAVPATADRPAEAQPEEEGVHQQPKAAEKRKPGRPPGRLNKPAGTALTPHLCSAVRGTVAADAISRYGVTS